MPISTKPTSGAPETSSGVMPACLAASWMRRSSVAERDSMHEDDPGGRVYHIGYVCDEIMADGTPVTDSERLRDPRWQRRRMEVMKRDGFMCCRCRSADKTLNVNHLSYAGDPWDAPNEALETLCEDCHGERSALERDIRALPTFLAIHIMRIAMRSAS